MSNEIKKLMAAFKALPSASRVKVARVIAKQKGVK